MKNKAHPDLATKDLDNPLNLFTIIEVTIDDIIYERKGNKELNESDILVDGVIFTKKVTK